MAYTLTSLMKIENKPLLECIDENFYKWSRIINKNISWYNEDVIDYMNYISEKVGKNKKTYKLSTKFLKEL